MKLRHRIAALVALGVAGLVIVIAAIGYLTVRSHLRAEIDQTLSGWGRPFTEEHQGPPRPARVLEPNPTPFGGAAGYFQFVRASGAAFTSRGRALLPVSARTLRIARTGQGSFFTDETVLGTHLRVLTVADPDARIAVQIARPCTEIDGVLHDLSVTYMVVVMIGIVLALLLGARLGQAAVAPIVRFTRRTEDVTGVLDGSQRLDSEGVHEFARLASSFNRTLDALEGSVRSRRQLLADASHELRTPISALRSNVQILLEADRLPRDDAVALRDSILSELDELTQLIANVIELARERDHTEEIETLRLDDLVSQAVIRARRRFPELTFELELEPTVIEHSMGRVERLVANLLSNSAKWSPAAGTVSVSLHSGRLSVRDRGKGFAEADLQFVFDRFYRAADARRLPGSGLGLAIVRQAAEMHGGTVEALNAPDGGAIVRVQFVSTPVAVGVGQPAGGREPERAVASRHASRGVGLDLE